jgi:hypothetical protein
LDAQRGCYHVTMLATHLNGIGYPLINVCEAFMNELRKWT